MGADLPRVTDRVHEPVAVGDPLRGHPRQRDRRLAVVKRRRGEDAGHRDVAVGGVCGDADMEPVAAPALSVPLRVPLGADVAGLRKLRHHPLRGHAALQPPPGRVGCLTASSPFPGRPGLGFGAGRSRPTIAVESREMCPTTDPSYAALTSAPCTRPCGRVSANHAKARERAGALGTSDTRRPAAQAAVRRVVPEPVDQGPRGREVPHRFRHERTRQGVAVGGRVPDAPVAVMEMPLHRGEARHGHEPAVRLAQRTDLLGEEGESSP